MIDQNQIFEFQKLLEKATNVMVIFGEKPSLDIVSSAASIYLAIKQMGKQAVLLHPPGLGEFDSNICGLKEAVSKLGNKNLVVAFDYEKEKIGDVSYHINEESKKFYLTIKPTKGSKPLDSKMVEFHYTEAEADLVILVGVHNLQSLGSLYNQYKSFYDQTDIVTIHKFNVPMGRVKINTSGFVCISEAIAQLLMSLKIDITPEIATNLLMGLETATDSFHSLATTGTTFAIASHLMKFGARRIRRKKSTTSNLFTNKLIKTQQKTVNDFSSTAGQPVSIKKSVEKPNIVEAVTNKPTTAKVMAKKTSKIFPKRMRPTFRPSVLK